MKLIDFQGQRSKVKVTMDKYGNNLVNMMETKPLSLFSSNFIHILPMMRGRTLLIFKVKGQGHNGHLLK